MIKFQVIIISIYITTVFDIQGQSVIAEFSLPSEKIENIQSYVSGDNIYLFYNEYNPGLNRRSYQIKADGTSKELFLNHVDKSVLISVREKGDSTWFYYLTGKKRALSLRAMIYNQSTGENSWLDDEIEIYGQILGISDEKALSIITYDKELNQLRILQVDQFRVVCDKAFDLQIDLSTDYKYVTYIPNDPWTSIHQGAAKFKLFTKDKKLVMSIDHTFQESNYAVPQTTVLIFDMESGTQSLNRFEIKSKDMFRSFIHHDTLYRAFTSRKAFRLQLLDLLTGDLIADRKIELDTTVKKSLVYLRNGKTSRISKKENMYKMVFSGDVWEHSVVAFTENDSNQTTVIWGMYYPDENGMMLLLGSNPLIGIISSIVATAIMQMREPRSLSRYFYIDSDFKREFNVTRKSHREIIDAYEISLDEKKIFFKYKAYFSFMGRPVGLYYSERTSNLKLVRF